MAQDSKMMALISVLSTLLIPLVVPLIFVFVKKDDDYVTFYSKQIIVLEIAAFVGMFISAILMIVLIGFLLIPIVGLGSLILYVLCIINALSGTKKPLPLIGGIWK
ncbi:MAG: DUF4870 domain-containing protein [archaeon]|jgi:hypothetical protein